MPEVSVIIPMYNAEVYVDDCINMILNQDFSDFEIIAVNDGSTDNTASILEKWADRDKRVLIKYQHNAGPGCARNAGMSIATGRYLAFTDVDDIYEPDYLSSLLNAADRTQADITICRSSIYDFLTNELNSPDWVMRNDLLPAKTVFSAADFCDFVFQAFIGWPWDKLFRTDFLRMQNLEYPPLRNSEDGVFVFSALCLADRITTIQDSLVRHILNRPSSVSSTLRLDSLCFFEAMSLIKKILLDKGVYHQFERSFINWVLHYSLWNLNMHDNEYGLAVYEHIHNRVIPAFSLTKYDKDYFYNFSEYNRMSNLLRYRFPESQTISDLQDELLLFSANDKQDIPKYSELAKELNDLKASRAYRLGSSFARPWRWVKKFFVLLLSIFFIYTE